MLLLLLLLEFEAIAGFEVFVYRGISEQLISFDIENPFLPSGSLPPCINNPHVCPIN